MQKLTAFNLHGVPLSDHENSATQSTASRRVVTRPSPPQKFAITVNRSFADRCPAFSGATIVEELVRDRW
jgi:hypothetical protein